MQGIWQVFWAKFGQIGENIMVTNYRFSFFKWILAFTICGNIIAAEIEISERKMPNPTVEAKDEISGIQLKFRKGFDPNLTVSASPDYKPDINHEFGASLGYAINNLFSPGFMGSVNIDKFKSIDSDNGTQKMIVGGVEGNATFAFHNSIVPFLGINLSRFYPSGENSIDYKPGFGFQAGVFGQVWKNIGYTLSYQENKNTIKVESPDLPPGYSPPSIKLKMKSFLLNVVVTI
jgi:hypothetical protein